MENESKRKEPLRTLYEIYRMTNSSYLIVNLVILFSVQLLVLPLGYVANWVDYLVIDDYSLRLQFMEEYGYAVLVLSMTLLLTIGMGILVRIFSIEKRRFYTSLLLVTALLLFTIPILPLGGYIASGGDGMVFGFQLDLWYAYPVFGFATLGVIRLEHKINQNMLSKIVIASLLIVLGILCVFSFMISLLSWPYIETSGETFPTPFSMLVLSCGVTLLSSAVINLAKPKIKT